MIRFLCKRLWCSTLMILFHQWSQMEHTVDTRPNYPEQYHLPLVADKTSVAYCFLSYPLVSSLYTSASSSPVVYFNAVWTEQLVVTWGWLCCSHSDIFKGGQGRHHCCLWSVGDSPACCTSSTLASSCCERSRACVQGRVQDMPGFDRYGGFFGVLLPVQNHQGILQSESRANGTILGGHTC